MLLDYLISRSDFTVKTFYVELGLNLEWPKNDTNQHTMSTYLNFADCEFWLLLIRVAKTYYFPFPYDCGGL